VRKLQSIVGNLVIGSAIPAEYTKGKERKGRVFII